MTADQDRLRLDHSPRDAYVMGPTSLSSARAGAQMTVPASSITHPSCPPHFGTIIPLLTNRWPSLVRCWRWTCPLFLPCLPLSLHFSLKSWGEVFGHSRLRD